MRDDFYATAEVGFWAVRDPHTGEVMAKCGTEDDAKIIVGALNARAELISVWPLYGYELEAFCDATVMPLLLK
jgi:hypothetical protein